MDTLPLSDSDTEELLALLQRVPLGSASIIAVRTEELALLVLREVIALRNELDVLKSKPDQPLLNAARRLVKATDDAERNYALADLVVALEKP